MNRNYLMVRAMNSQPNEFDVFFKNNVVAVGWSDINFTEYSNLPNELRNAVNNYYYKNKDFHPPLVGKKLNEVVRYFQIKVGDYIIVPFYNSIRLCIAKEEKIYNSDKAYDLDLANQIKVDYLMTDMQFKTIPRNMLSEGLQRRLRVRGSTVLNLYQFSDEIDKLFNKENYSWTSAFEEEENKIIFKQKEKLLVNIQSGKTNLSTGGIGLELLIKELFECEGYDAKVLSKNTFEEYGDADVFANKTDKFNDLKFLIQVKHHSGYTDNWGIEQLKKIKEDSRYSEYIFVLVTSAQISEKVRGEAESHSIHTMDGRELVDWIFENLNKLKVETKIKLGFSLSPQIIY